MFLVRVIAWLPVSEKVVCAGAGHGGEMILSGVLMERGPAQQPALSWAEDEYHSLLATLVRLSEG